MPHFEIKLVEGKTEAQKQALADAVIAIAQQIMGYEIEAYSVTIEDFSREDWFSKVYPENITAKKELLYKAPGYTNEDIK